MLQSEKIKFTLGFSLYTLLLVLISFGVAQWLPQLKITPVYPYILLFFYLFTLFTFYAILKSLHGKISRFTNTYMIINFLKLVLFSIIIFIYAYLNRNDAGSFVITFFVYYLFFTAYEVISLNKVNKKQ